MPMIAFFVALAVLIGGYLVYSRVSEEIYNTCSLLDNG